jgi:hypothetical protein
LASQQIGDWTGSERLPGLGVGRDIATGEKVEAEINSFISRRHYQRVKGEGERAVEDAWRASERREEARRAEEGQSRLRMCRHLQGVYMERSEEWGRLGDELEGMA